VSRRKPPRIAARLGGAELPLEVLAQVEREARAEYLRRRSELAPLPPAGERSSTGETVWQKQIIEVATRLGWWSYHPHLSRWSQRGWPDLSLLHRQRRRALWIECKRDDTHLTPEQVQVVDMMLACGLEVHVLRPWHGLERVAEVLNP
jgi:hypothetical protein